MTRIRRCALDEQMKWLVELQKADGMLREIERLGRELPREMERISQEVERDRHGLQKAQEYFEELQSRRRKRERDLEIGVEKVKKSQSRQIEIKTNKEYQALLKEIEQAKEANGALEEEILMLMEEMDECARDLQRKEKEVQQAGEKHLSRRQALESQLDGLDGESRKWENKRERVSSQIESNLMTQYRRIAERNNGSAVVRVERGTCLGCFLSIPPQLYNEILKSGPVVQCPFCMRFIHHEPQQETGDATGGSA
jgi:predicted  nucleic acid-binding Zn-ribbon protein